MENEILDLKFGGFYNTIHESAIFDYVAQHFYKDDISELEGEDDEVDYNILKKEYCQQFLGSFESFLKQSKDLEIDFTFENVWSPQEYNFQTDLINYSLSKKDHNKVLKLFEQYFKENEDFKEYCENLTTSRDGYWAFYSIEDLEKNKDNKAVEFLLNFLMKDFMNIDKATFNFIDFTFEPSGEAFNN